DALGQIADLLQFDTLAQLHIFEHLAIGEGMWRGPHILNDTANPTTFECPWTICEVVRGHTVYVTDVKPFPPNAGVDQVFCDQLGIRSLYGIPLVGKKEMLGVLVLGTSHPRKELSSESIHRAQILGEILAQGLLRSEREERLDDAVEAADIGLWSLDFTTMTFWATRTARAMHGFGPSDEISFDKVLSAVHPDDRSLVRSTIEQAATTPQSIRIEYRVMLRDSDRPQWRVVRGRSYSGPINRPQQLMGVCADHTERKQDEDDLRNARALTDAVFDSVPGLLYLYTVDGRLIRWNKQHEKMTGYSAEELVNFPVTNWFEENELPALEREWSRVFDEGCTTTELNLKLKNSALVPYSFTGVRVEIDGKPHLVGIGVDISENKRTEESLAQFRAELSHATRVTTLGELSSALAHELNQPLAAILSNAQAARRLLAIQPPDLDEIKEALDDIVRDDKRAGDIIHGLRGLLSKEKSEPSKLNLNEIIREMTDIVRGELVLSEVPLVLDLASNLPTVKAGKTEVQQVLLNLMHNGIAAQRNADLQARQLKVATTYNKNNVLVIVRDRGTGIPKEQMPRLFDSFFSTKKGGLGMGLAICRRIAETYNGKVWAENNADSGATFYLSLPIAEDEA
ncbi:MAG: ATP-binding protein, partial [Gammaproteobacteria bacterium]